MQHLKSDRSSSASTRGFTSVFKNVDGTDVQVEVQMDAEEFFNNLMDQLSESLKGFEEAPSIPRAFSGTVVHEIVSNQCIHRSQTKSSFFTLGIDIRNCRNLDSGLRKLVEKELLSGGNQYSCDPCGGAKVNAFKREYLDTLPNKLVVVLKRITFDLETGNTVKLNDYFEFPETLDLKDFSASTIAAYPNERSPEADYFKYSLKAVVIHSGSAEFGHYYSFIKYIFVTLEFLIAAG